FPSPSAPPSPALAGEGADGEHGAPSSRGLPLRRHPPLRERGRGTSLWLVEGAAATTGANGRPLPSPSAPPSPVLAGEGADGEHGVMRAAGEDRAGAGLESYPRSFVPSYPLPTSPARNANGALRRGFGRRASRGPPGCLGGRFRWRRRCFPKPIATGGATVPPFIRRTTGIGTKSRPRRITRQHGRTIRVATEDFSRLSD